MSLQYWWMKLIKKLRGSAVKNSTIDKTSKIESGTEFYNSIMEKYSFCGYNCHVVNAKIGKYTSIASNVVIGGATHPMEWVGMSPVFYKGRDSVKKKFSKFRIDEPQTTNIGNDVWIGSNVIIKSGVTIGSGAVVGMGSVVVKDIGSYEIWAGNPAKFIKYRFDQEIIDAFIKLEWWEFTNDRLSYLSKWIQEPKRFIVEANKV